MENEITKQTSKATLFGGRKKWALAIILLIMIALSAWLAISYLIPKNVTIQFETMEKTTSVEAEVRAVSVSSALEKLGVDLSSVDTVSPAPNQHIKDGAVIHIVKRLETFATVAGKKVRFILSPGTVEENLAQNNISFDDDDIVKPKLSKSIKCSSNIIVKDVRKVIKKKKKTVKSGAKIILDPSLASGVSSTTNGVDGVALYKYTYTYINGKRTSVKKKFKKWLVKPQDQLLRLGTASTGESGEVIIRRTFVSNTTAYYAGKNGRGALGTRCHLGTCAVDPKVFPYGSRFWVQGYGFCVANDCGGAIKGTKLDLYMTSTKQCYRWGRRHVTAYLLG